MNDKVTQENLRIVKDLFAAFGRSDKQGLLALSAEDIEWITPGEDWPLAGTLMGTRDYWIWFRSSPKSWKRHSRSPPNS